MFPRLKYVTSLEKCRKLTHFLRAVQPEHNERESIQPTSHDLDMNPEPTTNQLSKKS
jgi:hypothetical protein